jgi:hypothetical protein
MLKRMLLVFLTFPLIAAIPDVFAKGQTSKITISGADLKTPIEITDPGVLLNFNVWSGLGTSSTSSGVTRQGDTGFIIDWPLGIVTQKPKALARYQVSFYAKFPDERLVYVVFYEYDPANDKGYVYLPGKTDEWYWINVGSILRGVEGQWFFSSEEWEHVASPIITERRKGEALQRSPLDKPNPVVGVTSPYHSSCDRFQTL